MCTQNTTTVLQHDAVGPWPSSECVREGRGQGAKGKGSALLPSLEMGDKRLLVDLRWSLSDPTDHESSSRDRP